MDGAKIDPKEYRFALGLGKCQQKLRLYVWTNVLTDWAPGVAFALAESAEQAKEILVRAGMLTYESDRESVRFEGQEPTVIDEPFGLFMYGSS